MLNQWKCPTCDAELVLERSVLKCQHNHTFDVAKEGYVNLLLAHQKRSKEPGDNKAMINARRAFLEQGYYQPLADALSKLIATHALSTATSTTSTTEASATLALFDAGCGEGYYLQQVKLGLQAHFQRNLVALQVQAAGCDIAKIAIQKAAKQYRDNQFSVASTFQLPLSDASQDALIQVFAPASTDDVARVLQPGGLWLQVNPASAHLQELKAMVYDSAQQHEIKAVSSAHFDIVHDDTLRFTIHFANNADKMNLLMMTPFYWSASDEAKQQINQSLSQTTCHFHIQVLRKKSITP